MRNIRDTIDRIGTEWANRQMEKPSVRYPGKTMADEVGLDISWDTLEGRDQNRPYLDPNKEGYRRGMQFLSQLRGVSMQQVGREIVQRGTTFRDSSKKVTK